MLHLVGFQTFISLSSYYIIVQTCSKPSTPSKFASSRGMQIKTSVLCQGSHKNIFSALYIWSAFEPILSFQELSPSAQLNIYSSASFLLVLFFFQCFIDIFETLYLNLSSAAASILFTHSTTFYFSGFLPSGFSTFHKTASVLPELKESERATKAPSSRKYLSFLQNSETF